MAWTERGGGTVAVNTVVYQTPTADQVIQPGSDVTGLIVKGFAGGAANPLEVWDGAATPALASYGNSAGNWLLRNSLVLVRAGGNLTLTAANPAASRTYTIPDALANDSFAFLTAAQTLTNKTLTAPTIADFTNAPHDHGDADDGGLILAAGVTGTAMVLSPAAAQTLQPTTNVTGLIEKGNAGGTVDIFQGYDSANPAVQQWGRSEKARHYSKLSFPMQGYSKNLVIRTASATTFAVSWDEITLKDTNGYYRTFPAGSVTVTITNTGANGIDTGAMAASTLYYITIIAKNDETLAAVVHLASGTLHVPTWPTGYTWGWTVSWFYSNGSSQINPISQQGNLWRLEAGVTAGIMVPVNAAVPNNANWNSFNNSTWVPAGFGRMQIEFEGYLGVCTNTARHVSVSDGDSTLANTVNGDWITLRDGASTLPLIGKGWASTDGTVNQAARYKFNGADATGAVTINILKARIPTLAG